MKHFKILLAAFLISVIFYACSKDVEKPSESLTHAELRTFKTPIPAVQNGILKFTSKQHLSDFLDETIGMDDDERLIFENTIGFTSLYSTINTDIAGRDVSNTVGSASQPLVRNGISIFERSSLYQTVFNQHHELWVGDHIYKYVGDNLCARTTSPHVSEILDFRTNPDKIVSDNTELIDFVRDSIIKVEPRSQCQMMVRNPFEPTGNTGYVQVELIDLEGVKHTGICGGIVTINWGDGTTSGGPNNTDVLNVWSHQYPTPPLATCITYTVTFKVEFNSSSICSFYNKCSSGSGPLILTGTTTITICNYNTCTPSEHHRDEIRISENIYNNNNNCADFYLGYDLENNWFKEPKAWGRIIHYKKDGNVWKKSAPNFDLKMLIHGTAYRGNCDDLSANTYSKPGNGKKKDLKVTLNLDENFSGVYDYHLRTDNRLLIDWQVFHLSSTTPLPVTLNYPFYPW
jgi:hypothetical protein